MVSSNKKIFLYIIFSFYISTATLVFTVLIIIRESFQAIISARMYFCNLENVMEVIMLGMIFFSKFDFTYRYVLSILQQ